jgi:hypothetical protein
MKAAKKRIHPIDAMREEAKEIVKQLASRKRKLPKTVRGRKESKEITAQIAYLRKVLSPRPRRSL